MWWTRISEPRDARIERAPVSGAAAERCRLCAVRLSYFQKA